MQTTEAPLILRWVPFWLLTFVALWPVRGVAEAVLLLGAFAGLLQLLVNRFKGGTALLSVPAWALTTVLFAAYWLPELVSAVDAFNTPRVLRKAATDLLYLPFLWLVAVAVANDAGRRRVFGGLALIVAVWTVDAWVELLSGTSPLFWLLNHGKVAVIGRGFCTLEEIQAVDRLAGLFGPCNLKFGIVLAALSPFALCAAATRWKRTGWLLAAVGVGVVLIAAGSRASWVTYALVLLWSGWGVLGRRGMLVLFAAAGLAITLLAVVSPQVNSRIERTSKLLTTDSEGVDTALSGRLRIWSAASCMLREHPLTGVGVRGFREAYPACDPASGTVAEWGEGNALHAHQIVLEVLSETGVFGALLWLSGIALAWRAWWFADMRARVRARPAMLALVVTVFPLNTHLAAYSTFWGGVLLMLMALYVGSLWGAPDSTLDTAKEGL